MRDRDIPGLPTTTSSLHRVARRALGVLAVIIASLCSASVASAHGCAGAHTPIVAASRSSLQRAVVCLINGQRRGHHLPGLRASRRLDRSAQRWTNSMVDHRDFSHGADFSARISAVGFDWSSVGENIATGFATPASVVRAWMASTGHCENILNPTFRNVGTGVANRAVAGSASGPGTWTQDFALPMGASPASEDWGPAEGCPYGG